jgi:hypothetical protein
MGRSPIPEIGEDLELLEYIGHATSDAFWSWALSTVASNLREGLRGERFADRMGIPCLAPPMGPFPLKGAMGIKVAAAVLDRSMDPGLHEEFVQWGTFRGSRTYITNGRC